MSYLHKFGRNPDVDSAAEEDIWDGGGTWVAPTQARLHDIVSDDANDTAAGSGARTVRVIGLTSWTSEEWSEDITLNGLTPVATSAAFVIIHRMYVTDSGTSINAGTLTATAQTDSTVTAQINAGQGQTQMAIYGVSSWYNCYFKEYYASINRNSSGGGADISLLVCDDPINRPTAFRVRHTIGLQVAGNSVHYHEFRGPGIKISTPAIIKMRAGVSNNNTDISAGFDCELTGQ